MNYFEAIFEEKKPYPEGLFYSASGRLYSTAGNEATDMAVFIIIVIIIVFLWVLTDTGVQQTMTMLICVWVAPGESFWQVK